MSGNTGGQARVTVNTLLEKKTRGERLVMVTAYDFPTATLAERAKVDIILVGDSLGMVALGYDSTVPVTMADMIHHTKACARACRQALLVSDMPFMSYQVTPAQAVVNAGRLIKEGGAQAVKVEGGRETLPAIQAIVKAGIPVMGHLGLTPQTASLHSGYKVQGKTPESARLILDDALALQQAGVFAIVVECVPDKVASLIRDRLTMPLIGIGSGAGCDGQVLVISDLLGLYDKLTPRFVKRYAELGEAAVGAIAAFAEETRNGSFPSPEHSFHLKEEEFVKVKNLMLAPDE